MGVVYNTKIYSCAWLLGQKKNNKLDTNIAIQRREVWDYHYKSNLIVSMLGGCSIGALTFEKSASNDRVFKVIDGKQRTLTLLSFLEGGFSISKKILYTSVNGVDISGKNFAELSADMQDGLLDYQLSVEVYEPMDEGDRNFVFYMKNQSAPLSKPDLLPVVLGGDAMKEVEILCSHPFIKDKVAFRKPDSKDRNDLKMIIQYLILRSGKDIGFSGDALVSFSDDIKNGEEKINIDAAVEVLNYVDEAIQGKGGRAYLKTINVPAILRAAQAALEEGVSAYAFGDKLDRFFAGKHDDYAATLSGGSAKKVNVQKRVQILEAFIMGGVTRV